MWPDAKVEAKRCIAAQTQGVCATGGGKRDTGGQLPGWVMIMGESLLSGLVTEMEGDMEEQAPDDLVTSFLDLRLKSE